MNSLRGSASIGQLSNMLISLNRDLKSDENTTQVNVLKNRFSGETGQAGMLYFNLETGSLNEIKETTNDF